eukprot:RCo040354
MAPRGSLVKLGAGLTVVSLLTVILSLRYTLLEGPPSVGSFGVLAPPSLSKWATAATTSSFSSDEERCAQQGVRWDWCARHPEVFLKAYSGAGSVSIPRR